MRSIYYTTLKMFLLFPLAQSGPTDGINQISKNFWGSTRVGFFPPQEKKRDMKRTGFFSTPLWENYERGKGVKEKGLPGVDRELRGGLQGGGGPTKATKAKVTT